MASIGDPTVPGMIVSLDMETTYPRYHRRWTKHEGSLAQHVSHVRKSHESILCARLSDSERPIILVMLVYS